MWILDQHKNRLNNGRGVLAPELICTHAQQENQKDTRKIQKIQKENWVVDNLMREVRSKIQLI